MFFKFMVEKFAENNYEVLCTSRDYREVKDLAKLKGLKIKIIGKYGGKDRLNKLAQSALRIHKLAKIVNEFSPNLAISFSSPECSRVSYGLNIRHVVFNDSPHAEAVARLTLPLVNNLFCPWIIPTNSWIKYGIDKKKIVKYKALDPYVWIKRENTNKTNKKLYEFEYFRNNKKA